MFDVTTFWLLVTTSLLVVIIHRGLQRADPMRCTFTGAYENNHAPCLYVCRDNSENINSV